MSDPIRWLDERADALPHERELLGAGRVMDPPPGAAEKIWAALGPHMGPGGSHGGGSSGNTAANGSAGPGSSGASMTTTAVGGVKGAAIAIVGITTIVGAIAAFVMASPTNTATTAAPVQPAVEATSLPVVDDPPAQEPIIDAFGSKTIVSIPAASAIPTDASPGRTLPPRVSGAKPVVPVAIASATNKDVDKDVDRIREERVSRLREESRILADARAALRNGNAASALEKLDAAGGRFPDGILLQEREVLAIEALARSGQRTASSTRASTFLQTYPTSPHATKVRGFLQ